MKLYALTLLIIILTITSPFILRAQIKNDNQPNHNSHKIPSILVPALNSITSDKILNHIKILASDEFEGRAPGTRGDTLTVNYLVSQFKKMGCKPGNPNGTYLQKVPIIGFTTEKVSLSISKSGNTIDFKFPDNYIARSYRQAPEVSVENSEMIFAGYGIVAPEYGWNDYKNRDVKGKTVIILDNEPPWERTNDTSNIDTSISKVRIQTYYSEPNYKWDIAAKRGAAVLLIIHDPQTALAPFNEYQSSAVSERFKIKLSNNDLPPLMAQGFITLNSFDNLCKKLNLDAGQLQEKAMVKTFSPVDLHSSMNLKIQSKLREVSSHNIIAKVEGSDKNFKNEYVIYSAHWDHLGKDTSLKGDQIYNGAVDDASGVAEMLEIAAGLVKLKVKPRRTILFISTTAEEEGMIGAKYYATHPLYPLLNTLANINLDAQNLWGQTKSVSNAGEGLTTIDEILQETAAAQNRDYFLSPSAKQYFFRSDQIEFAKVGIPAVFPTSLMGEIIRKPKDYLDKKLKEYLMHDYHQVSDEVKSDWELSGAVVDAQWLLLTGYKIAQAAKYPEWKELSEFKAIRDDMIKNKTH